MLTNYTLWTALGPEIVITLGKPEFSTEHWNALVVFESRIHVHVYLIHAE
jgi:hypothetical protein